MKEEMITNIPILLAEDEVMSRSLFESLLERWGFSVISCANGYEAWEILKNKNAPRIALLDQSMPEMDGSTVCKMARENNVRCHVIFISVHHEEDEIEMMLDAGADDFIRKGCSPNELYIRLQTALRLMHQEDKIKDLEMHLKNHDECPPVNTNAVGRMFQKMGDLVK